MPILTSFKDEGSVPVKAWTRDIERTALDQLHRLATLPFIHSHVAAMADCHWGMGSTVGSVIPTIKAIVPAAVGVDIGCGMIAHKLSLRPDQLPDSLRGVRNEIENAIPHGRTNNGGHGDRGAWANPPVTNREAWLRLSSDCRWLAVLDNHPTILGRHTNTVNHLGSLGTGNHFVELCLDKEDGVWLMLHSGSRGIGNRLGNYFIDRAKEEMDRFDIPLADPDLAYLTEDSPLFDDYWKAVSWAQDFAQTNRSLMMTAAIDALSRAIGMRVFTTDYAVNSHHNYVAIERHFDADVYVTRKGAVRAQVDDMGIIPGSMGARSFIVRGKGNPESFCSCSHGAGRRMSRGEAKKRFTVADLAAQTEGIECRKDIGVVDEIPGAYKDIDQVMANQADLVEVVAELRQVMCVKG